MRGKNDRPIELVVLGYEYSTKYIHYRQRPLEWQDLARSLAVYRTIWSYHRQEEKDNKKINEQRCMVVWTFDSIHVTSMKCQRPQKWHETNWVCALSPRLEVFSHYQKVKSMTAWEGISSEKVREFNGMYCRIYCQRPRKLHECERALSTFRGPFTIYDKWNE